MEARPKRQPKKRAVNLFVDSDLLDEARRMGVNVSEILEHRLRNIVRAEHERRWLDENKDAFVSINRFIGDHDLLATRLRYRPAKA